MSSYLSKVKDGILTQVNRFFGYLLQGTIIISLFVAFLWVPSVFPRWVAVHYAEFARNDLQPYVFNVIYQLWLKDRSGILILTPDQIEAQKDLVAWIAIVVLALTVALFGLLTSWVFRKLFDRLRKKFSSIPFVGDFLGGFTDVLAAVLDKAQNGKPILDSDDIPVLSIDSEVRGNVGFLTHRYPKSMYESASGEKKEVKSGTVVYPGAPKSFSYGLTPLDRLIPLVVAEKVTVDGEHTWKNVKVYSSTLTFKSWLFSLFGPLTSNFFEKTDLDIPYTVGLTVINRLNDSPAIPINTPVSVEVDGVWKEFRVFSWQEVVARSEAEDAPLEERNSA